MKKLFLIITILLISTKGYAQCVAEIKNVKQDELRGSIVVETQYTLNGEVVQLGQTRYDDESGSNEEIITKVKIDIAEHCENLIKRIKENETYLQTEKLRIYKFATQPIIDVIKDDLIGIKQTKVEAKDTFKGKEIKVTYDSQNTISSVINP